MASQCHCNLRYAYCSLKKSEALFKLCRDMQMEVLPEHVEEMDAFFKKQTDTDWENTAGEGWTL